MRLLPLLALFSCSSPVTAVSYNAGLAISFVPAAIERLEPTSAAIGAIEADVVCLQEVWLPDQVAAVQSASSANFPHQYFMDPQVPADTGTPSCPDGEVDDLIECAEQSCGTVCDDELVDCVFAACAFQFISLEKPCMECVMAEIGASPTEIQATCEAESPGYAYGASFGIGVLSKHPIASTTELVFESVTNRRGAIHAVIDGPNGPFDFTCTHLSAVFSVIPYPRTTGSWQEEQAVQIDTLIADIDANAASDFSLVAGDMNTGPAPVDGVAEVGGNYDAFTDAGWGNPYAEQASPLCTYCGDNGLIGDTTDPVERVLLDHIFTSKPFEGTTASSRILDAPLETTSCGEPLTGNYSDHYGVSITFTP